LSPGHEEASGCGWRRLLSVKEVFYELLNKHFQTVDKG
jgi:hypothetical protein